MRRPDPENALPYPKIMVDDRNNYNIVFAIHEVQQRSKPNVVVLKHTNFPTGEMLTTLASTNFSDYDGVIRDEWIQLMRPHIGSLDKFPHFRKYNSYEEREEVRKNDTSLYTVPSARERVSKRRSRELFDAWDDQ